MITVDNERNPWLKIRVFGEATVDQGVKLWEAIGNAQTGSPRLPVGTELPLGPVVDVTEYGNGFIRRTLWQPPAGIEREP